MSNHDFGRLATRYGAENADAAALLLLALPGLSFLYQGDEIGLGEGPGGPHDRYGRDRFRHPMQWDRSPSGGFTTGEPWLPLVDPESRNVADTESTSGARGDCVATAGWVEELEVVEAADGLLLLRRGEHLVAVNTGDRPLRFPAAATPCSNQSPGPPRAAGWPPTPERCCASS